jgi:hypothetical protein
MPIEDKIIGGSVSLSTTGLYLDAVTEGGRLVKFHFVELPELRTLGVSNITLDQHFILFLDYDKITMEDMQSQLLYLHNEFGLSHFIVIKTGERRFHVVCFEKFMMEEVQKIVNNTLCDYSFKTVALKSDKGWILRLYPKIDRDGKVVRDRPEFQTFLYYGEPKRKLSRGHMELFAKIYPGFGKAMKDMDLAKYADDSTWVKLVKYGTSQKNLITSFGFDDLIASKKLQVIWDEKVDSETDN